MAHLVTNQSLIQPLMTHMAFHKLLLQQLVHSLTALASQASQQQQQPQVKVDVLLRLCTPPNV